MQKIHIHAHTHIPPLFTIVAMVFIWLVLCNTTVTPLADAMSQNDINSIVNNEAFYNTVSCLNVTGPVGSGPLYGLDFPQIADAGALANAINNYITNTVPSSPLKGLGADFVAAGQKYNINPAMIVGFAYKESTLGLYEPSGSYDAFGLTANGDIPGAPYSNGITDFSSWQASIDPEFNYVSVTYVHGGFNSTTILDLMKHYTPPDPVGQTQITLDVMHKILDGLSVTTTGATDSASVVSGCGGTTTTTSFNPGPNGYDLSGPNAMAHFYQCDTLDGSTAPWADVIYGSAGTVCAGGCGITSLTMVIDTLTNATETPGSMAKKYASYGGADGTSWSLWPVAAKDYGLTYKDLGTNFDAVDNIIHQGGLVIVAVGAGYFTGGGHLMVIRAVDNKGNFYLADPNGPRPANHPTETIGFSASFMLNQGNANQLFAFTKGGS